MNFSKSGPKPLEEVTVRSTIIDVDPDQHSFGSVDPDPDWRIRIQRFKMKGKTNITVYDSMLYQEVLVESVDGAECSEKKKRQRSKRGGKRKKSVKNEPKPDGSKVTDDLNASVQLVKAKIISWNMIENLRQKRK